MSQVRSRYAPVPGDKYYTPAWVVRALLGVETFARVWDPAGGDGAIIRALPADLVCRASDIQPDSDYVDRADFFACTDADGFDILTNPPYGTQGRLAVRFIEHALNLTRPHAGKVAMLVKVGFDAAPGRRHLFRTCPAFAAKHVLTRRILWANLPPKYDADGRRIGSTENHMWLIWDWRKRPGMPAIVDYPEVESADAG